MSARVLSDTSAVFYQGIRRHHVVRPSRGSGDTVRIHDDLRSALMHEVVEQMNESNVTDFISFATADGVTERKVVLQSDQDLFVRNLHFLNGNTAALANAATDLRVMTAVNGDVDLQGGPTTPTVKFHAEGFGTRNFPGQTELSLGKFDDTVGVGNTDALTVAFAGGFVLPANNALIMEVINNEGAALLSALKVEYAIFDRLALQPRDWQRLITLPTRRFRRSAGRAN